MSRALAVPAVLALASGVVFAGPGGADVPASTKSAPAAGRMRGETNEAR
jgi:hypothetical protein